MPDFLNMLKQQEIDRNTNRNSNDKPNTITLTDDELNASMDNSFNADSQKIKQDAQKEPIDPISLNPDGVEMTAEQEAMRDFREESHPLGGRVNELADNPYTWTPEYTQRGFLEEVGTSIVRGFGKHVIGGTGDIIQLTNALIPGFEIREGNMISRGLQEIGKEFEEEYKTFMPEELKDPSFSIATFTNPAFWSKHVAEYIPQLAEMILISRGMGGAAKGVARRGVANMTEGMSKEALERIGKNVVANNVERTALGAAKSSYELGGQGIKGFRSLFMTTEGTATKGFLDAAEGIGGGVGMNLLAGLQNSGQLVNEMKVIKDPDTGEPLYSEQDLADMAAYTMTENLKYLPMDMLSYGMVYGRSAGLFNKINPFRQAGKSKKFFDKAQQLRASSLSFTQEAKPILKGLDKIVSKMGKTAEKGRKVGSALAKPMFESIEEQFQETWEEWATKKAKAKVTGEYLTIDGKKSDGDLADYFTFFKSKENEATRAIAGALGFLGGAGSQIVEQINKKAEEQFKNNNKIELFKHAATNQAAYEAQQGFIKSQLIDNAIDGNVDSKKWIQSLVDNGVITKEDGDEHQAYSENVTLENKNIENIGDLNVFGKAAYLSAKFNEAVFTNDIAREEKKYNDKLKSLKEAYKDNLSDPKYKEKVNDTEKAWQDTKDVLMQRLAKEKHSILNILSKEKGEATNVKIVTDENGNRVAVGLSQEDLDNYYNKTDEEIFKDAKTKRILKKTKVENISNAFKNIYNSVKETFSKKEEDGETTKNAIEELTEENINNLKKDFINVGDQNIDLKAIRDLQGDEKTEALAKANEAIKAYNETLKTKEEEPKVKGGRFNRTTERPSRAIDPALAELGFNAEGDSVLDTENKIKEEIKGIDFTDEAKAKEAIDKLIAEEKGLINALQNTENVSKENVADYLMELGKESLNEATESKEETKKETKEETKKDTKKEEPKKKLTREERKKEKEEKEQKEKEAKKLRQKTRRETEQRIATILNIKQVKAAQQYTSKDYAENYAADIASNKHTVQSAQEAYESYLSSTLAEVKYGPDSVTQQVAINQHLRRLYPNTPIQSYVVRNLYDALGVQAVGYAIGSATMIDEKVWHQDELFMHEFAHIHYAMSEGEPATIAIINAALKNQKLVKEVLQRNIRDVLYTNAKGEFFHIHNKSEAQITELRKQPGFKMADFKYMPVILDELFASYLQGPLSEEYSRYFVPRTELTRQYNSKKWWKFVKKQATDNKATAHDIARSINDNKPVAENELNTFFLGGFVNSLQGVDTSAKGRFNLAETEALVEIAKNDKIISQLKSERELSRAKNIDFLKSDLEARLNEKQQIDPNEKIDDFEITEDEDINDMFIDDQEFFSLAKDNVVMDLATAWDKNFDTNTLKTNFIIEVFVRQFNSAKTLERQKRIDAVLEGTSEEDKGSVDAEILNKINVSKFKEDMYNLIESNESHIDFIRLLEDSQSVKIVSFLKFLKENFSDPYTRLRSLHLMYGNSIQLNAIINNVDAQGNYHMLTPEGHSDSKVISNTFSKLKSKSPEDVFKVTEALKIMRGSEKSNEATDQALETIIKFYAHDIDIANKLLSNGYLISNKSEKTLFNTFKEDFNNLGLAGYENHAMPFIKMLVNSGKKYSSTSTVIGPTGNQATTRMFKNFLTKHMSKIVRDLKNSKDTKKDLSAFMKKYTTSKSGGYNPMLHGLWKNYHEKGSLPLLTLELGSQNDILDNSKNYKDSTPEELELNEMLQFFDSINNDNGNYYTSLNIFGNSSRRILMTAPIIKGLYEASTDKYSTVGETHIKKMYDIYKRMMPDSKTLKDPNNEIKVLSLAEFKSGIQGDVQSLQNYFIDNMESLSKIQTFAPIYQTKTDPKTKNIIFLPKISDTGKRMIATFNFNRTANTYYTHDMVSPGLMADGITKKHKGIIAPVIALDPNLQIEAIPAADEYKATRPDKKEGQSQEDYENEVKQWTYDAVLANDGTEYILDIHAQAIEDSNPDFNKGYKIFSHNIEDKNRFFKGETSQFKGYTTVLTWDEVKPGGTQEHLKPYYDLLLSRYNRFVANYEAKYSAIDGKPVKYNPDFRSQTNIEEKREKYIPIITPMSTDKTGLFTGKDFEGFQVKYTLQDLKESPESLANFNYLLDKMYYANGEFQGLNGSNFGPQQIMDKTYLKAIFSIQALSSIMHSRTAKSAFQKATLIQEYISKQKDVNLQKNVFEDLERFGLDENGVVKDDYAYSQFILKLANKLKSDPYTLHALAHDEMAYSPRVSDFALNTFAKAIIREGNNLSVPGTYGQTISDKGYKYVAQELDNKEVYTNKPGREKYFKDLTEEYINGTSALNFYSEEEYTTTDVNGKPIVKTRTRPMELILPKSQNDGKTRARKSFYSNDGNGGFDKAKNYLMSNLEVADELGLTDNVGNRRVLNIQRTEEMLKKNTIYSTKASLPEDLIGTYIPGQLVMTTRIPHNGPAFMGVGEVVGFHTTGASNIIAPAEYIDIIGADHDGDALFVYKQARRKNGALDKRMADGYGNWNKAFSLMTEQWLSPDMRKTLTTKLLFESSTKEGMNRITSQINQEEERYLTTLKRKLNNNQLSKEKYNELVAEVNSNKTPIIPFGSRDYKKQYNNSVTALQTIGIAFNAHRALNILSTYQTRLVNGFDNSGRPIPVVIKINQKEQHTFKDDPNLVGDKSRIHTSTVLANIVMDSGKNGHADALNLNINSIMSAMVLANLGFSIEDIGFLFNHPMAKEFISKGNAIKNSFIDSGGQSKAILDLNNKYKKAYLYNNPSEFNVNIDPSSPTYRSEDNNMEVLRLMNYLSKVNSDLSTITNITSGHKNIERNSFALKKDIESLENLLENKKRDNQGKGNNSTLFFSPEIKTDEVTKQRTILKSTNIQKNHEINHYLKVAKLFQAHQKQLSLISNEAVQEILEKLKHIVKGEELTSRELKHFSELLIPMVYSRMLGINNASVQEIKDLFEMKEIVEETKENFNDEFNVPAEYYILPFAEILRDFKKELDETVYYQSEDNIFKKDTALTLSRLFHQAIIISDTEVKLNPQINDGSFSQEYINKIKEDFKELPVYLQRQFVLYDLIHHGWTGDNSLYPIFPYDITSYITQQAEAFQKNNKSFNEVAQKAYDVIQDLETINNKNFLPKVYLDTDFKVYDTNVDAHRALYNAFGSNKVILNKLIGIKPFRVDVRFINSKNEKSNEVIEIIPLGIQTGAQETINDLKLSYAKEYNQWKFVGGGILTKYTEGKQKMMIFKKAKPISLLEVNNTQVPQNAHLVSIPDSSTNGTNKKISIFNEEELAKSRDEMAEKKKLRAGRYFKQDLYNYMGTTRLEWDELMDAYEYKQSLTPGQEASLKNIYNSHFDIVQRERENFTPEKVAEMKDKELYEAYDKWAKYDAFAAAAITVPILDELTARNINAQSKITKRSEGTDDISVMKAYWQSNNIDSTHPGTQAIQREIETDFKSFMKERKKYLSRINKVTEDLYAEKLGYKPSKFGFIKKIQMAVKLLFKNRAQIYNHLYGELIQKDERTRIDGTVEKRWILHSDKVLKSKLNSGKISQAEYNFAEMFREIVGELDTRGVKPGEKGLGIPHMAMGRFESFSRKGLLGVLTNSIPLDQRIYDVKIFYENELMTFKEAEDTLRQDKPNTWKNSLEYVKLRRKASNLLKEKKNEDGSIFKHSKILTHTLLSDGMIDNFANGGWVNENAMLSMDLNKALSDFTHSKLFMTGNENFKGFMKLQAKVDGLFLHNKRKGWDNQNKFVRGVYKEYFLKAKKLNPSTTGDMVMDAMIKGNLLYIMGWKLLLKGKGLYAVGNILVGKYNNIKNQGGKAWLTGEKRYWGIGEQGIRNKKAIGVLKTLNFMDMNFYDDVNLTASSGLDSIFTDLALLPMRSSENWIQGAHFLGMLTEEQWNRFDENGDYKVGETEISNQELTKIENTVKNSHGKGYTPTDQRLIQRYSWGRAIMQFSRFIPTMFYDRLAKEDVNIYGQKHIGSLRAVYDMVTKFTSGELPLSSMKAYRETLDPEIRERFDAGLRGMAMVSLAIIAGQMTGNEKGYMNELAGDANYLINQDKLEYKLMPSVVRSIINLLKPLNPF